MEMSVNVEMPDQREMMDEMRDRLAPMFDRVQEQLVQATEDAFDIERELMDRRNVY
jgi:DNA-binding cell septation regulator SpoVG